MTVELESLVPNYAAIISGWTPTAAANQALLGDGWVLTRDLAELHYEALRRISSIAGEHPEASDEASILIGAHGLNLLLAVHALISRGQFDVASYLMRGILDAQSLLFAVISSQEHAKRYLEDRLHASAARKLLIAFLRDNGKEDEATHLDKSFQDDASAANDLAHASALHADKLLEVKDGRVTPVVGGRVDEEAARFMLRAVIVHEHWALAWFAAFRGQSLGEIWLEGFRHSGTRLKAWFDQGQR